LASHSPNLGSSSAVMILMLVFAFVGGCVAGGRQPQDREPPQAQARGAGRGVRADGRGAGAAGRPIGGEGGGGGRSRP